MELRKFVPLTVRVRGPEPAVVEVGEMDVTVGVGVVVPPPPVPPPPVFPLPEEPPQLERITEIARHKKVLTRRSVFIGAPKVKSILGEV